MSAVKTKKELTTDALYPLAAKQAAELRHLMELLNSAAGAAREYTRRHIGCTCALCRWLEDTYVGYWYDDVRAIAVTVPTLTGNVLAGLPGKSS